MKENAAGGSAVLLLKNGFSGVSVMGVKDGEIIYMKTEDLIKQRHVNLHDVAYFENLGTCFGRAPQEASFKFKEHKGQIDRFM